MDIEKVNYPDSEATSQDIQETIDVFQEVLDAVLEANSIAENLSDAFEGGILRHKWANNFTEDYFTIQRSLSDAKMMANGISVSLQRALEEI